MMEMWLIWSGLFRPGITHVFYLFVFITLCVPFPVGSTGCTFNRTYVIRASVDLEELPDNLSNTGVVLPFDRAAFMVDSHWGKEREVSVLIEETKITEAFIEIEIPAIPEGTIPGIALSFADEQLFPSDRTGGQLDGSLTTPGYTDRYNCTASCLLVIPVVEVIQDWLLGEDFHFLLNDDIRTEADVVEATLRITLEDNRRQKSEICSYGQFQCNDGRCLDVDKICNAVSDCLHGDDESICDAAFPLGSICNFEEGTCRWGPVDPFWLRHNGNTPSSGTGPETDHTRGTSSGYYMYTEASDMDSAGEYVAQFVSPLLDPPTTNGTDSCKVKFFYHMRGSAISSLSLFANGDDMGVSSKLFYAAREIDEHWHKAEIIIDSTFFQRLGHARYSLEFQGETKPFGERKYRGDMAIDDFSMSPECFGIDVNGLGQRTHVCDGTATPSPMPDTTNSTLSTSAGYKTTSPKRVATATTSDGTNSTGTLSNAPLRDVPTRYFFTSCGQIGATGPSSIQCDNYYRDSNVSVSLHKGYQKWTVPRTGFYRITAMGARGGRGVNNPGPSNGAAIQAVLNLTEGHSLYILVGQAGYSSCSQTRYHVVSMHNFCKGLFSEEDERRFGNQTAGGGGGGGGGTFVAIEVPTSIAPDWRERLTPLVVAGGGGGLSFNPSKEPAHGMFDLGKPGSGESGRIYGEGNAKQLAGAGGGWYGNTLNNSNGRAFIFGGQGGHGCLSAYDEFRWELPGGFGGGGGGCTSGGGGGGYTGGNGSSRDSLVDNGVGGSSFVNAAAFWSSGDESEANEHGQVEIEIVEKCPDESFVPLGSRMCEDGELVPLWAWLIIMTAFMLLFAVLLVFILCRVGFKRSDEDRLRNELALLRKNVMSEVNPLYGARKNVKEEDFPELPRTSLKLLHPLGKGCFGEVYKGVYYACPDKTESMSVAIKTLSKDATEEDKNDFLMEAVIMGSLKNINIVRLVGVSFIRVPKFLILEFMHGGELKVFLQNNRPSYNKPSGLTMLDLLKIAVDVADGCKYLESLMFIHRDLAARNILLTTRGPGRVAKIGDFGMAKDIYKSEEYRKTRNSLLPVKWMPPEAYLDGIFSTKTDVWSYGVLLWEIMTFCYLPYPGLSNHEVVQCVANGDRMSPPRYCPDPVKSVMVSCWRRDSEQRPTFEYLSGFMSHLCTVHDVISVPIPRHGIEVERSLVTSTPEAERDINENSPMIALCGAGFTADDEGYLQADLSPIKQERKSKPIRLDKIKVDFPKNVEMNIYDSEVPTSGSTSNYTPELASGTPNDLDHEYSFPPISAQKRNIVKSISMV